MGNSAPESLVNETPDTSGAFPRLTPPQLDRLRTVGRIVPVAEGQVLARAGESFASFSVVLDGRLLVYEGDPVGADALFEIHGPARFVGDIGLLEGEPSFATIAALESGSVLDVPIGELERIVTGDPLWVTSSCART